LNLKTKIYPTKVHFEKMLVISMPAFESLLREIIKSQGETRECVPFQLPFYLHLLSNKNLFSPGLTIDYNLQGLVSLLLPPREGNLGQVGRRAAHLPFSHLEVCAQQQMAQLCIPGEPCAYIYTYIFTFFMRALCTSLSSERERERAREHPPAARIYTHCVENSSLFSHKAVCSSFCLQPSSKGSSFSSFTTRLQDFTVSLCREKYLFTNRKHGHEKNIPSFTVVD